MPRPLIAGPRRESAARLADLGVAGRNLAVGGIDHEPRLRALSSSQYILPENRAHAGRRRRQSATARAAFLNSRSSSPYTSSLRRPSNSCGRSIGVPPSNAFE